MQDYHRAKTFINFIDLGWVNFIKNTYVPVVLFEDTLVWDARI